MAGAASTAEEVAAAPSTGAADGVNAQSGQEQVMYITHAAKTKTARQWRGLLQLEVCVVFLDVPPCLVQLVPELLVVVGLLPCVWLLPDPPTSFEAVVVQRLRLQVV